jgi:formylmethanofuran dehydrogenase subunit A
MPSPRLEGFVPAMRHKGRLQQGADADLVQFNADHVGERARYGAAKEYPNGLAYVLVNGQFVVRRSAMVPQSFPGRPIYSDARGKHAL